MNHSDNSGKTALMIAAEKGHKEMVKALIAANVDVTVKENSGYTALHYAAGEGKTEMVPQLLAKGAKVDAKDNNGSTALHHATRNGHTEMVKQLIVNGARIEETNNSENTALMIAKAAKHNEVVETLEFMEDMSQGKKKLLKAALEGNTKDINDVIANIKRKNIGPDIDIKQIVDSELDAEGRTALMIAAYKGHTRVVGILLAVGANVDDIFNDAKDNDGNTALHHAAKRENNQEVVRQLLDAGADKNARNKDEKTAYEVADDSNKGILGDVDNKGTQSGSLG